MRYPEEMVSPMRQELVQMGFEELRTVDDVRAKVEQSSGTVLVFVSSVCGCAGGIARPGLALALSGEKKPAHLTTTFAGMDLEATDYARGLFSDYPPSSPQVALFKDGREAYARVEPYVQYIFFFCKVAFAAPWAINPFWQQFG